MTLNATEVLHHVLPDIRRTTSHPVSKLTKIHLLQKQEIFFNSTLHFVRFYIISQYLYIFN